MLRDGAGKPLGPQYLVQEGSTWQGSGGLACALCEPAMPNTKLKDRCLLGTQERVAGVAVCY